jgi:hypothetical protein
MMPAENLVSETGGGKPPPKCKALLICDHCREDPLSARISLVNLVESFRAGNFPSHSPLFTVFAQLVDGIGSYAVSLEVHDLLDGDVAARTHIGDVTFPERPAKMDVIIPDVSVLIPHAGRFDLVLFANGQELDRQFFDVEDANEKEEGQSDEIDP